MRKVVYNSCYGGFSLSLKAQKRYLEKKGHSPKLYDTGKWYMKHYYIEKPHDFYDRNIKRHDEDLVAVVEELGDDANGECARLRIEILDDNELYSINEYDGNETVKILTNHEWQ